MREAVGADGWDVAEIRQIYSQNQEREQLITIRQLRASSRIQHLCKMAVHMTVSHKSSEFSCSCNKDVT